MSYVARACARAVRVTILRIKKKKGDFRDFRNSVPANNVYHKIGDAEFNTQMGNLLPPPPPLTELSEKVYKTMEFLKVLGLKTVF